MNRFDELPSLTPLPSIQASNELRRYLESEPEHVKDAIAWWHEHRATYPHLSCIAIDYQTIPATLIEVERLFSHGRLVISHVRSRLGVQSSRALICLGIWSRLGLVKAADLKEVSKMPDVEGDEEVILDDDWDNVSTM